MSYGSWYWQQPYLHSGMSLRIHDASPHNKRRRSSHGLLSGLPRAPRRCSETASRRQSLVPSSFTPPSKARFGGCRSRGAANHEGFQYLSIPSEMTLNALIRGDGCLPKAAGQVPCLSSAEGCFLVLLHPNKAASQAHLPTKSMLCLHSSTLAQINFN